MTARCNKSMPPGCWRNRSANKRQNRLSPRWNGWCSINQSIEQLRAFLRQGETEIQGIELIPALEKIIDDARRILPIETHWETPAPPILNAEQISHLTAFTREALSNAIRHADTDSIEVRLECLNEHLRLIVHDFGRGLPETAIRQKFHQSQVVMLTSSANENFALEALRAGAAGYVLKQVGSDELVRAVRAAHNGETALDPKTAARLVARLNELQKKTEADAFRDLSQREMEVLNLVARGWNNKEIAQALNLSEITARNYVTTIMEKLHLRNRVELAAYAIRNHIEERM